MRKLMEYKIISGRVVETRRTWFSNNNEPCRKRNKKANPSSEKKIRANEKGSIRNLARVINCNFEAGDIFCTLSYDSGHYSEYFNFDQAKEDLKKFRTKLRKAYNSRTGKKLKAIWVTANWSPHRGAPARLHHHMILPGNALEIAREIWQQFGGPGTFKMEDIDNRGDHSDLAAYMAENVHDRPAGENTWSCCRGMDRPIYTEPIEVTDMEDIQPEYGSIIMDVEENRDDDGVLISRYMRCKLPQKPDVRGGQIILPKKGRRKT